jgi:hypothetical protein
MAPDTWHHLEGTLPRDRLFRLHVYDDYARSLPAAALAAMQGRVVTRQRFDTATRTTIEERAFPLKPSKDGKSLEAAIDRASLPSAMSVQVRFKPDAPGTGSTTFPRSRGTRAPRRSARPVAGPPSRPGAEHPDPRPTGRTWAHLRPAPWRDARRLRKRRTEIDELIKKGDYGASGCRPSRPRIWRSRSSHTSVIWRAGAGNAEPALGFVRTAWLLDSVGDTGNAEQVGRAYTAFVLAVSRLLAAFEPVR